MKRLALLLAAVALFMPACDDDDNPAGPSNLPVRFINDLRPSNEVPPITNADQGASGNVIITVDVTRDSGGTITAVNSSEFIVSMSGFPAGTVLTGAHIHQAPAGQNAGILINLNVVTGDITLATGSGSFTKSPQQQISVEQLQNMINNPAGFYFNVHTQLNLNGAIRGQLVRVQ